MNKNNYVAIMAGGIGSRFWPVSRLDYPKQFLDILNSGRTLIQSTYDRFAAIHTCRKYLRRNLPSIQGYRSQAIAGTKT